MIAFVAAIQPEQQLPDATGLKLTAEQATSPAGVDTTPAATAKTVAADLITGEPAGSPINGDAARTDDSPVPQGVGVPTLADRSEGRGPVAVDVDDDDTDANNQLQNALGQASTLFLDNGTFSDGQRPVAGLIESSVATAAGKRTAGPTKPAAI